VTPSGIETATNWLVAHCLDHCATACPLLCRYPFKFLIEIYYNLIHFKELISQSRSQVYIKYSLQLIIRREITFVPILKTWKIIQCNLSDLIFFHSEMNFIFLHFSLVKPTNLFQFRITCEIINPVYICHHSLVGTSTHPKVSVNTRKSWVCIRACGIEFKPVTPVSDRSNTVRSLDGVANVINEF